MNHDISGQCQAELYQQECNQENGPLENFCRCTVLVLKAQWLRVRFKHQAEVLPAFGIQLSGGFINLKPLRSICQQPMGRFPRFLCQVVFANKSIH